MEALKAERVAAENAAAVCCLEFAFVAEIAVRPTAALLAWELDTVPALAVAVQNTQAEAAVAEHTLGVVAHKIVVEQAGQGLDHGPGMEEVADSSPCNDKTMSRSTHGYKWQIQRKCAQVC